MINLDNFIVNDFIKNSLMKSNRYITTESELNSYIYDIMNDRYQNAIFESSNLKMMFFDKLKFYDIDVNIINCNSSTDRFCEELDKEHAINIFDNVNRCHNTDILKIIQNTKGILIC